MVNIRIPEDVVDKNQDLLHWAKYVVRMCTDTCSIVVDKDNSIDDLSKLIQGTPAGRMKGGVKLRGVVTYVGIWTQHTNGFEANSRAWDRPAPYTQCQTSSSAGSLLFAQAGLVLQERRWKKETSFSIRTVSSLG